MGGIDGRSPKTPGSLQGDGLWLLLQNEPLGTKKFLDLLAKGPIIVDVRAAVALDRRKPVPNAFARFLAVVFLVFGMALPLAASVEFIDDDRFSRQLTDAFMAMKQAGKLRTSRILLKTIRSGKPKIPLVMPSPGRMPQTVLYESLKRKVLVHCSTYKCPGSPELHVVCSTAYAIATDVVVLNYHTIDDEQEQFHAIADSAGDVFPVKEILAVDRANDVAIVRTQGGIFSPLALSPDEPVGSPVLVMSHPDDRFYVLTQGSISRYCRCRCSDGCQGYRQGNWLGMSITADFAKGSSGAPILNLNGNVVGMVASTKSVYYDEENGQQKNLQMVMKNCVPARCILDLIDSGPMVPPEKRREMVPLKTVKPSRSKR